MTRWARAKPWLPVLVWAGVISTLSTDTFSSERTSALIIPTLHWLIPHASNETLLLIHAVIRKTAHLTEYFILGILLHFTGDFSLLIKISLKKKIMLCCLHVFI